MYMKENKNTLPLNRFLAQNNFLILTIMEFEYLLIFIKSFIFVNEFYHFEDKGTGLI